MSVNFPIVCYNESILIYVLICHNLTLTFAQVLDGLKSPVIFVLSFNTRTVTREYFATVFDTEPYKIKKHYCPISIMSRPFTTISSFLAATAIIFVHLVARFEETGTSQDQTRHGLTIRMIERIPSIFNRWRKKQKLPKTFETIANMLGMYLILQLHELELDAQRFQ